MSKIEFGGHTQYSNGGYDVIVSNDGSIDVKSGDWLSKYSVAIYGDYDHIDRFLRRENGIYKEIENKDLIHVGETLWHKDVVYDESPDDGYEPPGTCPVPQEPEVGRREVGRRLYELMEYFGKIICPYSEWSLAGSSGGSIGVDSEGIKVGLVGSLLDFSLSRVGDSAPTEMRGVSLGGTFGVDFDMFSPVSVSISPPSFKSTGLVAKLPGAGATLSRDELSGAFLMIEGGLSCFVGGSLSLVIFGIQVSDIFVFDWTGPARFLSPMKGAICTAGLKAAPPDGSVSAHWGYMWQR